MKISFRGSSSTRSGLFFFFTFSALLQTYKWQYFNAIWKVFFFKGNDSKCIIIHFSSLHQWGYSWGVRISSINPNSRRFIWRRFVIYKVVDLLTGHYCLLALITDTVICVVRFTRFTSGSGLPVDQTLWIRHCVTETQSMPCSEGSCSITATKLLLLFNYLIY